MLTLKTVATLAIAWGAGFASVGAFAWATRPAVAPPAVEVVEPRAVWAVEAPQVTEVADETRARVIDLDPVFIVAALPRRHAAPAVAPAPELSCGEFRELLQGSATQRVRLCE